MPVCTKHSDYVDCRKDFCQAQSMSQLTSISDLQQFDFIVAIARGGMIPAFLISRITDIRNIDTFICQSYSDDHLKQDVVYFPKSYSHLRGKKVLIIDELVETGDTLRCAVDSIREALPADIKTMVVFRKDCTQYEPDYYIQSVGSEWIHFKYDEVELNDIISYIVK
jgi:hypoxanthine phosphoribosyltransferase